MERADGGDLEVFITPQFNDEIGALTGYFNRMLQSINKAEANFRALSDNAEDGILIIEEQGATVYANRRAGEITGFTESELPRLPFQKLVQSATLQKKEDRLWQEYATHQETSHVETTVTASSGDEVPVELTVSRIPDDLARNTGLCCNST